MTGGCTDIEKIQKYSIGIKVKTKQKQSPNTTTPPPQKKKRAPKHYKKQHNVQNNCFNTTNI